jgi:hypothetical protein
MPIIFTRGGLSARGAGTFSLIPAPPSPPTPGPPPPPPPPGPPPPVVQTVTFTSSGSWTAPAGVSQISSLFIGGGNYAEIPGQFVYTSNIAAVLSYQVSTSPPTFSTIATTYEQAGSAADGVLSLFNRGGTGEREVGYNQLILLANPSLPLPTRYWNIDAFVGPLIIRGTASRASGPWDNRSPVDVANGIGNGWYIGVELYYPPETVNGSPSSAFGYTVQGGTQNNPAPVEAFGSVSVTPGQTYSINVGGPQGGFVQFQFVQG